jgi:flagellar hook-associated protein 3 FlgL
MTGTSSSHNTGLPNGSEPADLLHKLDQLAKRLAELSAALRSGNQAVISASITALDPDRDQITITEAEVGSRQHRVESAIKADSDGEPRLRNSLSDIENADLPGTTVDLQMQQVAYQAALAATAKVMQPSLLDFLR